MLGTERVSWIDLTKAISLVSIIVVHSITRDALSTILTGFVIPAFFILYGVTHRNEKHRHNMGHCIRSRFRSLMIPYILLSVSMLVLYSFLYPIVDMGLTPADFAFWLVYGSGPAERVSHLWFLRTMFFTIVVFLLVDKYLHDKPSILRYIIILCLPALGVMTKTAMGVELVPWGIDSVFIALSFMMIGNEIRRHHELSSWSVSTSIDAIAISISLIVFVWLSLYNGFVNVGEGLYGQSIYIHMITGVLGTHILSVLSYYFCRHHMVPNLLSRFIKYGQEIYELHPLMIEINVQLLGGLLIWDALMIYPNNPLFIVNLLSGILVSWLIASKVISKSRILRFVFLGKST